MRLCCADNAGGCLHRCDSAGCESEALEGGGAVRFCEEHAGTVDETVAAIEGSAQL